MENNGWIKLHRKFLKWEWYDEPNTFRVFLHLLLICNHSENQWRGMTIKSGQKITSYGILAKETGLSIQNVRTSLERLKSTGEITYQSTNRFGLVTINHWNDYQETNSPDNNQLTINQQTTNSQLTTNKNDNNKKNEKNEEKYIDTNKLFFENYLENKKEILDKLEEKKIIIAEKDLDQFFIYWSEKNKYGKKRWELEKTFEVHLRIIKWISNLKKWEKVSNYSKKEVQWTDISNL